MKKNNIKDYKNKFLLGLIGISIYFFLPQFQALPFILLKINTNNIPQIAEIIYLLGFNLLILALIAIVFHKKLEKDFIDIKKNHEKYFKECINYWLIGMGVMMLSNIFISIILNNGVADNEELIRTMFKESPIYVYLSAVIIAPLTEELIFRLGIRNIFPTKILFLMVSTLVFGGLHVVTSMSTPLDLLYLIPYCSLGFAFAYSLYKTNNIFVSIGLHMMHNGLLISLQFLQLIFS